MKLTIEKCIALQNGLRSLDVMYDKVIEDGKNSKKVVSSCYDLSKKVIIENGIRLARLEAPIKQYQTINNELIQKYGKAIGDEFKVPPENMIAYKKEDREALDVEVEVDLPMLNFDDLKIAEPNPIPGLVLALLEPIREGGE